MTLFSEAQGSRKERFTSSQVETADSDLTVLFSFSVISSKSSSKCCRMFALSQTLAKWNTVVRGRYYKQLSNLDQAEIYKTWMQTHGTVVQ